MLQQIANRRHDRMMRIADVVRPDQSYYDLLRFKDEGYEQAVFVKNPTSDEECRQFDGKVWNIDDLLAIDPVEHYVIYWISHPNCLCHFAPYGKSSKMAEPNAVPGEQVEEPQLIQKPEVPPMTMQPAPPQPKTV